MVAPRAAMFWSGGKDSAMALHRVRRSSAFDVTALITTINPEFGRVSMHGVRQGLIERQAEAVGLPLERMLVGSASTNEAYVAALRQVLAEQKARGVEAVIFGDIFLADLRAWREGFLAECGVEGVFPLWGEDTRRLAEEFVSSGFKAIVCCANDAHLDGSAVGRNLDRAFFAGLPASIDPCGENGEYHTFVYDGPVFARPVPYICGEPVYRPLSFESAAPDQDAGHDAAHPAIPVPSAPAQTTTPGFWFLDLRPA